MNAVPKNEFRALLHLVPVGAVAVAIIGFFFGAGFLLLTPLDPAAPTPDPVSPAQTLRADEIGPPPRDGETARDPPSATVAEKEPTNRTPETVAKQEAFALTPVETTLAPPARTTHAKRAGLGRHRHLATGRRWTWLWLPDARAGPNPGGGFYGPPNINVGYINPR